LRLFVENFVDHPPTFKEHTAVIGQSYTIPCDTAADADVRWFFDSVHGQWTVYEFGRVRKEFRARFSLNTSVHGLDISNVTLNDTGNYTCIGRNGKGDHHIHQLTVLGKYIACISVGTRSLAVGARRKFFQGAKPFYSA